MLLGTHGLGREGPYAPFREETGAFLGLLGEDADARAVVVPAICLQDLALRAVLTAEIAEPIEIVAPRLLQGRADFLSLSRLGIAVAGDEARHLVVVVPDEHDIVGTCCREG